jgi:5'(3')-deoxyribonucleotidase
MEFFDKLTLEFWSDMPKMPWADELVDLLSPYEVIFLTNPIGGKGIYGRMLWIEKHFPHLSDKYLIGPSKHACANPQTILIDDHEDNTEAFVRHGGEAILVPARFNSREGLDPMETIRKELRGM